MPKSAITELSSPQVERRECALALRSFAERAARPVIFSPWWMDGIRSIPNRWATRRLRNLLWVRCTKALDAVKAADLLLRDGNFPLVVLDLVLNASDELRKIPQTSWYRLQRLVEAAPTAFLVLTRASIISSAQLKLSLDNAWTLADLEQDHLTARLKILVKRAQGGRQAMRGSRLMFATIYLPDFYLQAALAPSTGVARKTCGLNRRSGKKSGDHSAQCRGRTNRCATAE